MADYEYLTDTGTIVADTEVLQTNVQGEYKDVFAQDLNVDSSTVQGMLIDIEAASRASSASNNAAVGNQINPNIAGDVFLDSICSLTMLDREPKLYSIIPAVLTGVAATVIPSGSLALTTNGDTFECVSAIILDGSGDGSGNFQAIESGEIPVEANTLTSIVTEGITGWETITNSSSGTIGEASQSDASFRATRKNTLAFQSISHGEAVISALYHVANVKSLSYRNNPEGTSETIDGITLPAHSMWACVDGGVDISVAAAILENKGDGCAMYGSTNLSIVEPVSGQTYNVKWDRPDLVDILVRVTIRNGVSENVKTAVLAYANGEVEGLDGFTVGADVVPSEIACAINALYTDIEVRYVEISRASPISWETIPDEIDIWEKAQTFDSYITVVIE